MLLSQEGKISILELTGLNPNQKYSAWYCVESEDGGKGSISYTFTTLALPRGGRHMRWRERAVNTKVGDKYL